MVRTIYTLDDVEITEEQFHALSLDPEYEFSLDCYCECLECGRKLLVCESCDCEFED